MSHFINTKIYKHLTLILKQQIRFCISCSFLIFQTIVSNAQQTGSVCISDKGDDPHPSAMLDVKSKNKGVLFPKMSFETLLKIENKKDGLMVFVTDSTKMGYWYWNATESKWIQVRSEETSSQDIQTPLYGIIMYSGNVTSDLFDNLGQGKEGTKMAGWQICNGKNGSPDLTGKFIMGSTTRKQETGGSDYIQLKTDNMPLHKHNTKKLTGTLSAHNHLISENLHFHSVTVIWKKIGLFNRHEHIEVRNEGYLVAEKVKEFPDVGHLGKIKMQDHSENLEFNLQDLQSQVFVKNAGEGKQIDNRPPFYVLIYIMRIK